MYGTRKTLAALAAAALLLLLIAPSPLDAQHRSGIGLAENAWLTPDAWMSGLRTLLADLWPGLEDDSPPKALFGREGSQMDPDGTTVEGVGAGSAVGPDGTGVLGSEEGNSMELDG